MKTIGTALQTHLDTQSTTLCFLLKITPAIGSAFGVTSLDIDVAYDDGGGSITYSSSLGMNQSAVKSSAGLEVDNSEAMLLVGTNFTREEIAAGNLDYGTFHIYRINWNDTSQGHYLVQSGRTGIVKSHDELSGVIELRAISQQLKQNYNELYSIGCRAVFGSTADDEMFPCLFDASTLWTSLTVDTVGTESDRVFTTTGAPSAAGPNGALGFDVAIVEWLTGTNAGLTVETETVSGTSMTLRFPAAYAIESGDTLRIRPDCAKRFNEDCIAEYDNYLNFRGEPLIPLTEESQAQFPGANVRGVGAPPVANDPTDNDDPNLQGSITWDSRYDPLIPSSAPSIVKIWCPSGGVSVAFTVPVTVAAQAISFAAVTNTSSNGTKVGSISDTVADFAAVPNSPNLVTQSIAAIWNDPAAVAANPVYGREVTPGGTYFWNFKYDDGEANWITTMISYDNI